MIRRSRWGAPTLVGLGAGVLAGLVLGLVPGAEVVRAAPAAPAASSGTPLPRRGDRGPVVVALQKALLDRGIPVRGGADGTFGAGTAAALSSFQTSVGLIPSGVLDATSAALLGLGPTPTFPVRGDRGETVRALQQALIALGVPVRGGADGVFGAGTAAAIGTFQTGRQLPATGQLDLPTAIALGLAPGSPPVTPTSASPTAPSPTPTTPPAPAAASNAMPKAGERGENVALLQRSLVAAGVNLRGGADGIFGQATTTALRSYQEQMKISATGILDEPTAQLLGLLPAPSLPKFGESGDLVRRLQQGLIDNGAKVAGGADGAFGKATSRAVAEFQAARGLDSNGIVDLRTWVALTTRVAEPSTPSSPAVEPTVFPVEGPCWFTDTWRAPRSGGRRHEGVDIIAPSGRQIVATVDGTITRQFLDRPGSLGGNALRLTAADGTHFHYAHLSRFADGIAVGSTVTAGQVIGFVGSTGSSSTPHLHFEYHPNGRGAVNPYPFVKAINACGATASTPPTGQ